MTPYPGKIAASRLIGLRFSQSGYVTSATVQIGKKVTRGEVLAALDPKPVQTQLDIDLANFRRIRAEFDKLSRELPEAKNEDEKGVKEIAQSKLDIAVKNVEITKYELDHLNLISPVNGIIIDDSNLISGIYATPSGFPVIIADTDSFVFESQIPETTLPQINTSAQLMLKDGQNINSKVIWISPEGKGNNDITFTVRFELPPGNYRLGQSGQVNL